MVYNDKEKVSEGYPMTLPTALVAEPQCFISITNTAACKEHKMLILTIKEGHCFHIGDDVAIQVETHRYDNDNFSTGQMKNQVRFNIDAPKSVTVLREEIYRKGS